MSATIKLLDWIGEFVARQLSKPTSGYEPYAAARPELVAMVIRPGDVLLVEGARSKINFVNWPSTPSGPNSSRPSASTLAIN